MIKMRDLLARLIGLFALATVLIELALRTEFKMAAGEPFYAGLWSIAGYFTIWSNLLVAYHFLSRKRGDGAHAAFTLTQIIIVALIYNTMLRGLRHLDGLALITDNALHVVVPALVLLQWIFFASKEGLGFLAPLKWLWFVVIYGVAAFTRGGLTGKYPYPFINVEKIGIAQVILNSVGVGVAFYLVGAVLVAVGRISSRENK